MLIWIAPVTGILLNLALMRDVYSTVFVPRGRAGPLMRRVYGYVWWGAQRLVGPVRHKRARQRLSAIGPLLVALTFLIWGILLIVSYTLIYYPWSGRFAPADIAGPLPEWVTALYYSGYAATTLGVGDVYPQSAALRLVAVLEAAQGFGLFSVSVTYLLSIYGALSNGNATALEIARFVRAGRHVDGPLGVLVAARETGETELVQWLQAMLPRLSSLIVAQGQYPLLHYFHSADDRRAFPLAVGDLLAVVTIARTVLCPDSFPSLANGPTVDTALDTARGAVMTTLDSVDARAAASARVERERSESFRIAYSRLDSVGLPLRDQQEARERYLSCRSTWDEPLARMRAWFSYPTEERAESADSNASTEGDGKTVFRQAE